MTDSKNTEAEATAVDEGVQNALPMDARWYRREARKKLIGKSGMNAEQKRARVEAARDLLNKALEAMDAEANVVKGEVEADD